MFFGHGLGEVVEGGNVLLFFLFSLDCFCQLHGDKSFLAAFFPVEQSAPERVQRLVVLFIQLDSWGGRDGGDFDVFHGRISNQRFTLHDLLCDDFSLFQGGVWNTWLGLVSLQDVFDVVPIHVPTWGSVDRFWSWHCNDLRQRRVVVGNAVVAGNRAVINEFGGGIGWWGFCRGGGRFGKEASPLSLGINLCLGGLSSFGESKKGPVLLPVAQNTLNGSALCHARCGLGFAGSNLLVFGQ